MSGPAFGLRGLRLVSPDRPAAELEFGPGLNVVSGASDTGKTYAVECIDFMLGGSRPLRDIDEVEGYSDVLLGLERDARVRSTLKRPLSGGKFLLVNADLELADVTPSVAQLSERHNPKGTQNISSYLLGLCGLLGKRVLVKAGGASRQVSFRNILHLAMIHEGDMFKRGPLFLSGQYAERVLETSVFRLLLTGADAQAQAASRNGATQKARSAAQVELLDELIHQAELELRRLGVDDNASEGLKALEGEITEKAKVERFAREQIAAFELRRQKLWREKETVKAKGLNVEGLLSRFSVLKEQYVSDRDRLSAVTEADFFFAQLPIQRCPFCGAEQAEHAHARDDAPVESFREAASREVEKIDVHLKELDLTISFLESERTQIEERLGSIASEVDQVTKDVEQALKPRLRSALEDVAQLLAKKADLEKALYQREHLGLLYTARTSRKEQPARSPPQQALTRIEETSEIKLFCMIMQELLSAWQFPGDGTVRFDPEAQDFIISGKPRANFGKGLRAVSYAAFTVALMLHAYERNLPHPGFVILDSPLVTYRKRDVPEGEAITDDIKDAFFDDLVKRVRERQVVVFENEEPSADAQKRMRFLRFTGNPGLGRAGLIPIEDGAR